MLDPLLPNLAIVAVSLVPWCWEIAYCWEAFRWKIWAWLSIPLRSVTVNPSSPNIPMSIAMGLPKG